MKIYSTVHVVKGEDLNHHGTLFAARAAGWLVEAGLTAAACEHGKLDEVVMRNLQNMSFTKPVPNGTMLSFESRIVFAGNTSFTAAVRALNALNGEQYMEGYITFVTVESGMGGKKPHHIVLDETEDTEELRQREQAALLRRKQ